jgi:hypothetical protein
MTTDYKSPLPGLLDYIVPDYIEQQAISGFSRDPNPMNAQGQPLYGGFTPNIDPNNPQGLSNIETLFGTAYMPQSLTYKSGGPTNKQLIDASILRAGLELGRGRMPGESFGGALQRGAEEFAQPGKTLSDARLAQAKAQAAMMGDGTQLSLNKIEIQSGKKLLKTLAETNPDFGRRLKKLAEDSDLEDFYGFGGPSSDFYTAMANELASLQNAYKGQNLGNIRLAEQALINMGGDPPGTPVQQKDNKSDKKDLSKVKE